MKPPEKKKVSKKKIITSLTQGVFAPPSEKQWDALQSKLGANLSSRLRFQLEQATNLLAVGSPANKQTITVTKAAKSIDLWQGRTRIIRKLIWSEPAKPSVEKLTQELVRKHYTEAFKSEQSRTYLGFLSAAIDGALLASEYVVQQISDRSYPGTRQYDLWIIWVTLIVTLLNNDNIEVMRTTERRKELKPRFVSFMGELQTFLPPSMRSRATHASLLKGLNDARDLIGGDFNAAALIHLLIAWGTMGVSDSVLEKESNNPSVVAMRVASRRFIKLAEETGSRKARKPRKQ